MTMHFSLVLFVVSLSLVQGDTIICKCDDKIIEKITKYWNSNGGTPKDVTTHTDPMKFTMGTESEISKVAKCKSFSFTGDGRLHDLDKNTYAKITESSGVITFPDSKSYVISYKDGVYARYRCTQNGPQVSATNLAEVAIATTAGAKESDITSAKGVLKNLGFEIKPYTC